MAKVIEAQFCQFFSPESNNLQQTFWNILITGIGNP